MSDRDRRTFYLVWSPTGPHPPTVKHTSEGSARVEAQRLARFHRGQKFVVVQAVVAYQIDDLRTIEYAPFSDFREDDDIPF